MNHQTSQETVVVPPSTEKKDEGTVVVPPASPETVVPPTATPTPTPPASVLPATPVVDYREKFGHSTRENQILQGELEALNRQLGEITKEEIPTDAEMIGKYPEYEFADELSKGILKRQEVMDRRQRGIQLSIGKMLGSVTRRNEIAAIVATNAALVGKEQKFIDFASDPKRANVPVETLVSAFLYEVKDEAPAPTVIPPTPPAPTPTVIPPATALERGTPSGGESPAPTNTERTPEELKALRTSNPKEYNELVRKGQI